MNEGFTLVEIMVVMVMIGLLSTTVAVAYPHVRSAQKLTLVEQQLQATLREAQQRAINEDRDTGCLLSLSDPNDPQQQKTCSDIGVVLNNPPGGADGEFIVFADTHLPQQNTWNSTNRDYILKRVPFPTGVRVDTNTAATTASTFIFEGTPPTITLFIGRDKPLTAPETVTFKTGTVAVSLFVQSYGQVEKKQP